MIKKLRIKNFQNHEKLAIKFSDKVTTIIGKSDAGKSSVLRALRWALSNKPNGSSFIRTGEKSVAVRIETDGHTITRRKGKSNTYEIDGEELHSFGSDVPQKIQDVLKMREINFQGQHDAPFWLSDSAGQVSRNLNQIVDLGIIDSSLSNASKKLRQAKTETEIIRNRIDQADEEKQNLKWTKQAEKDFAEMKCSVNKIESLNSKIDELEIILNEVDLYQDGLNRAKEIKSAAQKMMDEAEDITELRGRVKDLKISIAELDSILKSIKETKSSKSKLNKQIKEFKQQIKSVKVCETCQRPL
tara:strand:- start:1760 stop:2662 length:903 start_codon:yes stop_codon:yes gene_type:complete